MWFVRNKREAWSWVAALCILCRDAWCCMLTEVQNKADRYIFTSIAWYVGRSCYEKPCKVFANCKVTLKYKSSVVLW